MFTLKFKINGTPIEATEGCTILQAAIDAGIHIPTLCHLKDINVISACRMCVVEVAGTAAHLPACSTPVAEGMEISTNTPELRKARRKALELICANHRMECTECERGMNCELRDLCKEYEVDDKAFSALAREPLSDGNEWIVQDNTKCILCRRCLSVCEKMQGLDVLAVNNRSIQTNVGFGLPISETQCTGCGQCAALCPTGAITIKDDTRKVWKAMLGERAHMVALLSPYVCTQIGEIFGEPIGQDNFGKTAAMLRYMGFEHVYLVGTAVSACPAWKNYLQAHKPQLLEKLPEAGTPWARAAVGYRNQHSGKKVFLTAFTTCSAAKSETGYELDSVLTTRELAEMWRRACVSNFTAVDTWDKLPLAEFDEADFIPHDDVTPVIAKGLATGIAILETGETEKLNVLACPNGCIMGGGSPSVPAHLLNSVDVTALRRRYFEKIENKE